MKAITLKNFGGIENFELQEVATPKVKPDELLIEMKATAFNPIDYQMRKGSTESKLLKSPILGRELSGIVIDTGESVRKFKIGEKVSAYVGSLASNGTYAEYVSVPQELVAKIPDTLSFEQAAALPMVGMTALQCFKRVPIAANKPVFISGGAGGVGTILIKLLLSSGTKHIFTTTGNEESRKHLLDLGIGEKQIFNYKQENLISAIQSKAAGSNFEYCIDLVGGSMSEICAQLIDVYGTYVDVTYLVTEKARELLFDKATHIINIANYAHALKITADLSYYGNALAELFDKINNQQITPAALEIVGKLSVESVREAHQRMEKNLTKGKKLIMTS